MAERDSVSAAVETATSLLENADLPLKSDELDQLQIRLVQSQDPNRRMTALWSVLAIQQLRTALAQAEQRDKRLKKWIKIVKLEDALEASTRPSRSLRLYAAVAHLRVELAQAQQENERLGREALNLAAERTFILGNDIPETIERARAVLVQRVHDAESALAQAQQEIARLRRARRQVSQQYQIMGAMLESLGVKAQRLARRLQKQQRRRARR